MIDFEKWERTTYKISDMKPYGDNPRDITKEGLKILKESMESVGYVDDIALFKDGTIASGHARYYVCKHDGVPLVPVKICRDELTPKEMQEVVFRMNANQAGKWDTDILANRFELADLKVWGLDLLNLDLPDLTPIEEPGCDEDEVPEVKDDPITKRGDVWLLGDHRVMCGDSTVIEDVDKLMNGEKADMVFTDPPYNLAGNMKMANAHKSKGSEMLNNAEWDKGFIITEVLKNIQCVLSEDFYIYIFTSHFLAPEIWAWLETFCKYTGLGVYHRTNPTPMSAIRLKNMLVASDMCCYGHSEKAEIIHDKGKVFTNVWSHAKTGCREFEGHPTQKPISLCVDVVCHTKGDKVLDLFLGSGSTLIACEKTNRKCYGMELDEKYCDVIINRWQKYTGKEAILESTGESYNSIAGKTEMPPRCL